MGETESYVSSSHTVAELKVMCKENGLSVAGRKSELIDRLNQYFLGNTEPEEEMISLEEEEVISLESEESISLQVWSSFLKSYGFGRCDRIFGQTPCYTSRRKS